jgi:RNA polymerase sigma factor (sigma-70 family)
VLSKNEQEIVTKSLWVVNTAFKKLGLPIKENEDLRQDAILYMCKCVQRYDKLKDTKIETYLFKNIYLYIKRQYYKEKRKQIMIKDIDIASLSTSLKEPPQATKDQNESKYLIKQIKAILTPFESLIIDYKLKGYTCPEISKLTKKSVHIINNHVKKIKSKARELKEQYKNEFSSYL